MKLKVKHPSFSTYSLLLRFIASISQLLRRREVCQSGKAQSVPQAKPISDKKMTRQKGGKNKIREYLTANKDFYNHLIKDNDISLKGLILLELHPKRQIFRRQFSSLALQQGT